jgi:hypothetical protein
MCIGFHIREQFKAIFLSVVQLAFHCVLHALAFPFYKFEQQIIVVATDFLSMVEWGKCVRRCDYIRFLYAIRERTDFYYKLQKLCDLSSEVG